ncbi:FAD dependent oxidoreductase [Pyrenochaeta sp. MPI-SDFR-AT-0127]|nr:FAD dependent oxidoreductase [Pyrenochaeta sp. MPI-SDFR-AT-0127]
MNGHATANGHTSAHFDVLIIGAGLSGINAAYRIQESLPSSSFALLEARHELGGTWSQFKYPGVRSDSDLHTLGFQFNPWKASHPIASGDSIMEYLNATADKFDIKKHIRCRHKVVSANWSSDAQQWKLAVDIAGDNGTEARRAVYWTKWLIMGTGYYSYDEPLRAQIPGLANFKGRTVHPQFWPEDLDYKGKKMVIIGSGATAITLLPAMVDTGVGSVTQLQRSPSYILSLPQDNPAWWEKYAPQWFLLKYKRFMFTLIPILLYYFCMSFPTRASNFLRKEAKRQLPADFPLDPHFKPGYNPWQQRLCLCPDGDYFKCFASGRAHIVTDTIKNIVSDGIELNNGTKLDADIIVTATGLKLRFLGGIDLSIDGHKVDVPSQYLWRFSMLTSLPNLGNIIGYWNASWTLGSDTASRLFVRLIKHQNENNYTSVVPVISEDDTKEEILASPLSSTYVKNALSSMPKCGSRGPWRPRDHYFVDRWRAENGDLNDGLKWEKVST